MKEVLVIDDEPAIRKALKRVLERAGYAVRVASDGAGGIRELRARAADFVITDIIMPNVHGVDAIKTMVREFPLVKVIAISGGGNFSHADYNPEGISTKAYLASAKLAGAHATLTKPFRTEDVLQALELAAAAPTAKGNLH